MKLGLGLRYVLSGNNSVTHMTRWKASPEDARHVAQDWNAGFALLSIQLKEAETRPGQKRTGYQYQAFSVRRDAHDQMQGPASPLDQRT